MPDRLIRMSDHVSTPRRWLWRDRIPLRSLTLLDGDPGTSKSTLTCDIAARVTVGRGMFGSDEASPPANVILIQGEDTPNDTQARLQACNADLRRSYVFDQQSGPVALPDDIPWLEATIRETQARLVVIDPAMSFLGAKANSYQAVHRALSLVAAMAQRTGVAVVLVRHLNKSGGTNPLYRGAGSIAVIGAVRSGLFVGVDPSNPERRVLAQTKSNLSATADSLSFRPISRGRGVGIEWLGTSAYSARNLLEAMAGQSRPELEDAMLFVFAVLSEGPTRASEILSLGVAEGFSRRTIRRAKEALRVLSERTGFGREGYFLWRLPSDETFTHLHEQTLADLAADGWRSPVAVLSRPAAMSPRRRRILRPYPVPSSLPPSPT